MDELYQICNRPYYLFTFDQMASFSCGVHSCFVHNRVKNKLVIGLKINSKFVQETRGYNVHVHLS